MPIAIVVTTLAALLGLWLLVAAGRRLWGGYPPPDPAHRRVSPREAALVRAAAEALYPPGGPVPPSGADVGLVAYVDRYLAAVPAPTRRLIRLLLLAFEQATLVFPAPAPRGRRRFSELSPEQREAVLEEWRTASLFFRRLAFTSLRALLTLGYFAHPEVLRRLGLAPLAIETPAVEADRLYPPVGRGRDAIRPAPGPPVDLRGRSPAGEPLDPHGPLDPRYGSREGPG